MLQLLAIVLPPSSYRLPVTVVSVLVALTATGRRSARPGDAPVGPAVLRTTGGGAVAMGVTYPAGTLPGMAGV